MPSSLFAVRMACDCPRRGGTFVPDFQGGSYCGLSTGLSGRGGSCNWL